MKRTISFIAALMLLIATVSVTAQEQPAPKKDTVNMDTYAKPEKFYEIEDDDSGSNAKGGNSGVIIAIVAGVIVIAGAAGYFLTRKKK